MSEKIRRTTVYAKTRLQEIKLIADGKENDFTTLNADLEATIELILRSPYGGHNLNEISNDEVDELVAKLYKKYPTNNVLNYVLATKYRSKDEARQYIQKALDNDQENAVRDAALCTMVDHYMFEPSQKYKEGSLTLGLVWFAKALQNRVSTPVNKLLDNTYFTTTSGYYKHPKDTTSAKEAHDSIFALMLLSLKMIGGRFKDIEYTQAFKKLTFTAGNVASVNNNEANLLTLLRHQNLEVSWLVGSIAGLTPNLAYDFFTVGHREKLFNDEMYAAIMELFLRRLKLKDEKYAANEIQTKVAYDLFKFFTLKQDAKLAKKYFDQLPNTFKHFQAQDFVELSALEKNRVLYQIFVRLQQNQHFAQAMLYLDMINDFSVVDDNIFQFLDFVDPLSNNLDIYHFKKYILKNMIDDHTDLSADMKRRAQERLAELESPQVFVKTSLASVIKLFNDYINDRNNRAKQSKFKFAVNEFFTSDGAHRENFVSQMQQILDAALLKSIKECMVFITIFQEIIAEAKNKFKGEHIAPTFETAELMLSDVRNKVETLQQEALKRSEAEQAVREKETKKATPSAAIYYEQIMEQTLPGFAEQLRKQIQESFFPHIIFTPDGQPVAINQPPMTVPLEPPPAYASTLHQVWRPENQQPMAYIDPLQVWQKPSAPVMSPFIHDNYQHAMRDATNVVNTNEKAQPVALTHPDNNETATSRLYPQIMYENSELNTINPEPIQNPEPPVAMTPLGAFETSVVPVESHGVAQTPAPLPVKKLNSSTALFFDAFADAPPANLQAPLEATKVTVVPTQDANPEVTAITEKPAEQEFTSPENLEVKAVETINTDAAEEARIRAEEEHLRAEEERLRQITEILARKQELMEAKAKRKAQAAKKVEASLKHLSKTGGLTFPNAPTEAPTDDQKELANLPAPPSTSPGLGRKEYA